MTKPLIPPDHKQCQCEIPNGNSFMTLGGIPGYSRCTNTPTWIAKETEPASDGQVGSMCLCDECKDVFVKQMPDDYATLTKLEDTKK